MPVIETEFTGVVVRKFCTYCKGNGHKLEEVEGHGMQAKRCIPCAGEGTYEAIATLEEFTELLNLLLGFRKNG